MALKKTTKTVFGLEVVDAYHRVEGVRLLEKDKIQFQLRSSLDGVLPHFSDAQHECAYSTDGVNPIAQAYNYIKTLPDFADAKDC
jgi:hypothetical protein